MATKYFVDVEDVQNWGNPLLGVDPGTKLYDSKEEAERVAHDLTMAGEIPLCVWEHKVPGLP